MKLEHVLFTFYINCNGKWSSASVFLQAAQFLLWINESKCWTSATYNTLQSNYRNSSNLTTFSRTLRFYSHIWGRRRMVQAWSLTEYRQKTVRNQAEVLCFARVCLHWTTVRQFAGRQGSNSAKSLISFWAAVLFLSQSMLITLHSNIPFWIAGVCL